MIFQTCSKLIQQRLHKERGNRSPAPHLRLVKPLHIANYSSETCLNEPEAQDEQLHIPVMLNLGVVRCSIADIHLRLRPGTDGALALAMAHVIIKEGLHDSGFIDQWSIGFESLKAYVEEYTPAVGEAITGVPAEKIIAAARLYATIKPAAIINSGATTVHHTNGIQSSRAIAALIGLTGNF